MFGKDTLLIPTRPLPVGCAHVSAGGRLQQCQAPLPKRACRLRVGPAMGSRWEGQRYLFPAAHVLPHAWRCRPEYSTWAGMIVTHYGRLGPSDDSVGTPSDSPYAHFSRTRAMQQLRGYYSTGPSRSQSPQYGSGAGRGREERRWQKSCQQSIHAWSMQFARTTVDCCFHARLVLAQNATC